MKDLVYHPLDESKEEIRVLTLLPGAWDEPLRGVITIMPFAAKSSHAYDALSYVWGSTDDPASMLVRTELHSLNSVQCDTRDDFAFLVIGKNLSIALPYLRYPDKSRTLWINAICINQNDLTERSSQVQRMHIIFARASRVIMWLGPETSTTKLAFKKIEHINSIWHYDSKISALLNLATDSVDCGVSSRWRVDSGVPDNAFAKNSF